MLPVSINNLCQKNFEYLSIKGFKKKLLLAFLGTFFLSAFIYLEYFNFSSKTINTALGIFGIYFFLFADKKTLFIAGFFTGIFWFWWIGLSFRFYKQTYYLVWIIPLLIGLTYATLFYFLFWFSNVFWRSAAVLFCFDIFAPFGFEWFKPEIIFANSFIGVLKIQFASLLLAVILLACSKKWYKLLFILFFIFSLDFSPKIAPLAQKIKLIDTKISQKDKWKPQNLRPNVLKNLDLIDKAQQKKYDVIVLPESSFALFLNTSKDLTKILKEKSKKITIVAGSLFYKSGEYYNSTYIFKKGKMQIINKVFLVPFGEKIPLPKFLANFLNNAFFGKAKDFKTAQNPQDYTIQRQKIRNAICYEATVEKMYKNTPKYIIVISNNGWFYPSTQAALQKQVMLFFARKYSTKIYHSANMQGTGIIN